VFGWPPGRRVVDRGCVCPVFHDQDPRLDETPRLPHGRRHVAIHPCITRPVIHSGGGFSAGVRAENPPQKWITGSPPKVWAPARAIPAAPAALAPAGAAGALAACGRGTDGGVTVRQEVAVGVGSVGSAPEREGAMCVRCLEVLYLLRCPSPGPVGRFGALGGVRARERRAESLAQAVVGSHGQWRVRTGSGGLGQVVVGWDRSWPVRGPRYLF
jgi:hypothetical protein